MRKKLLIELIIYIVLVVIGSILLFTYEPKEKEIIIPQDFRLETERGVSNATVYFQ